MKKQVIKRDGSTEIYDESKIIKVTIAAGLSPQEAKDLASQITQYLKDSPNEKISSLIIRDHVVSELKKVNKSAADLFHWYEATKDN